MQQKSNYNVVNNKMFMRTGHELWLRSPEKRTHGPSFRLPREKRGSRRKRREQVAAMSFPTNTLSLSVLRM